ncbi:MAG: carbohydrate kinase family protein [Pseudomonadota bacterium]
MTGRPGVLAVGRLYCDLIFTGLPRLPSMGTEVFAGGLGLYPGGGAVITAAHLAELGRPAALSAIVPAPPFDAAMMAAIEAASIDVGLSARAEPGADPQLTVALADAGDRAFVTRRVGPAAPPLSAAELLGQGFGHLHIGELATLVERPELLALAREAGLTVSLDCGWDDGLEASAARSLIPAVDVFLPNAAEVALLENLGVPGPWAPLTAIKCGADGARAEVDGHVITAPTRAVPVVDTTGAGDAFNAGFLDAWLDGGPVAACLAAGNAKGAEAVQRAGGFGRPAMAPNGQHRVLAP